MDDLYSRLAELEERRALVVAVRQQIQAEAEAARAGGQVRYGESEKTLAEASGESLAALQRINRELAEVRQAIIAARLQRGDAPDCPANTISAWWPFLGPWPEGAADDPK